MSANVCACVNVHVTFKPYIIVNYRMHKHRQNTEYRLFTSTQHTSDVMHSIVCNARDSVLFLWVLYYFLLFCFAVILFCLFFLFVFFSLSPLILMLFNLNCTWPLAKCIRIISNTNKYKSVN